MWPLQDGAGKPVMMTQQPGREKWDSWEMNEFAALFSVTNEAGKWVRTTGWLAAQLGRDTAAWAARRDLEGGTPPRSKRNREPTEALRGWKCRESAAGRRRWSRLRYTNK